MVSVDLVRTLEPPRETLSASAFAASFRAPLRAVARAIFDNVYPGDDWSPVSFDEAERFRTDHYRNAVEAARMARAYFTPEGGRQLALL